MPERGLRVKGYLRPWRRRAAERDMEEELQSIAGMADPRELGNLTLAAEDVRAQWGWTWLEQTAQDVRFAVRTLGKAPAFMVAAVLSLAIGIGANTALFTLIDTVMWKLLPVGDPEHLLTIGRQTPTGLTNGFTYQQYEIFRDQAGALDLSAYSPARLDVSIDGQVEPATDAHLVTGQYFPLLRLRPALGRLFDESDDRVPLGHHVAVLSHAYWQRRFGADPAVLGRTITLGRLPFTIVGVAPAEFFGAQVGLSPSLYLPVMMQPALLPMNGSLLQNPNVTSSWLRLLGRLKPGVPLEQAGVRLNALAGSPATGSSSTTTSIQGTNGTRWVGAKVPGPILDEHRAAIAGYTEAAERFLCPNWWNTAYETRGLPQINKQAVRIECR